VLRGRVDIHRLPHHPSPTRRIRVKTRAIVAIGTADSNKSEEDMQWPQATEGLAQVSIARKCPCCIPSRFVDMVMFPLRILRFSVCPTRTIMVLASQIGTRILRISADPIQKMIREKRSYPRRPCSLFCPIKRHPQSQQDGRCDRGGVVWPGHASRSDGCALA